MLHFPLGDEALHRPRHILYRDVGVDAVLVVEVDRLHTQEFEGPLSELPNELRPAVHTAEVRARLRVDVPTELRRDDNPPAERRERFPQELFVLEGAIHLGGAEEGYAALDRGSDDRACCLSVGGP